MKKKWKKLMAAWCAIVMLMTMPGVGVLADEMRGEDELIVEEAVAPEEPVESVDAPIEGVTESVDAPINEDASSPEAAEEVVGEGSIQVGDGVTATFDADTGAVEFASQNGELWRDWVDKLGVDRSEIESIRVASGTVYLPADSSGYNYDDNIVVEVPYLFGDLVNLTDLDLSNFDTSKVTDMHYMFVNCSSLTDLDLSNFDTSKVCNMEFMFSGCSSLTNLDLSNFDTSNVCYIGFMFSGCSSLTNLDLSNFDTSNVCDMDSVFSRCSSLTKLDLSSFDTSNVTDTVCMFYGCSSLTSLGLSSFDMSNVTYMGSMFQGCSSLTNLDLSNFDTTNVWSMGSMFSGCRSLTDLDLSNFDTSKVTKMDHMFSGCRSLTDLDLSNFDTSNVEDMRFMFPGCSNLTSLDLSSFDTSNVTSMWSMFESCSSLTNLDLSNFDTAKVTDMGYMFCGCSSLTDLDLGNFDTTNVNWMPYMFSGCSSLTDLDLSKFDTSNVDDMKFMFFGCSNLTDLDLGSFDTPKVTTMWSMFESCSSLTNLDLSNFDTSNVVDIGYMFYDCSSLSSLNLSGFDTTNVQIENSKGVFTNCNSLMLLNTPKKNSLPIELPLVMYDESGNDYINIPDLSESIILTREMPSTEIDITACIISLASTSYTYDGKVKEPTVIVKNGDAVLTSGTDYIVSYLDNTNAGTATVTVTGTGNYKGEKSVTFTIDKADAKLTFADNALTKKTTDAAFANTLTKTTDGTVTFKSGDTKVAAVDSTSGLVTINGAGTTTITATASEGQNYKAGSASYTLKIEAPAPTPATTPTVSGFSDVQDPKHAFYNAIYWAANAGITKGYPDGTFGVDRNCTRGEMMMFLWRYSNKPTPKKVSKSPFKDVPMNHAFYNAILWGSQKGITKGYPDGSFGINRNVSRGECMMFLWRLKNKPSPKAVAKTPFPDVPKSHAFYNAILWGYQKKITNGFTSGPLRGKFGINENCSRGQIVTFLYRAK